MKAIRGLVVLAVATLALTACGGPSDTPQGGSGETVDSIDVPFVFDTTGPAAPFASEALKGAQLAVEQFNADGGIDGVTINPVVTDSASDAQQAAAAASKGVRDGAPVMLYGTSGSMALAMAPIAQEAGIPIINVQSGVPTLLEVGEFVYRSTPAQPQYHRLQAEYLADQGVKSVAVLYNTDNATYNALGSEGYKALGEELGFSVVSEGIASTDTDVSTVTASLASTAPDAFVMLLQASNNTVATELRRNGYEGIIAGTLAIGIPALESMGEIADGIIWPDIFAPDIACDSGQAFIEAFQDKYDYVPGSLAASGYDGARMLIEGLRNADSFDAAGVQAGLVKVLETGVQDAAICEFTFEDRDPRSSILLQEWQDGAYTTIATSED